MMQKLIFVELDGTLVCLNNVQTVSPWSEGGSSALITFIANKDLIVRWNMHKVKEAINEALKNQ